LSEDLEDDDAENEEVEKQKMMQKNRMRRQIIREKNMKFNADAIEKQNGLSDVILNYLETCFDKMMFEYDFLSVVMYPDLKNRRLFVHDAWLIAKYTENFELKFAISKDPYFFITRDDIY
jgi:hypothetical protein